MSLLIIQDLNLIYFDIRKSNTETSAKFSKSNLGCLRLNQPKYAYICCL
ncbi:hypothetical protein FDUTEX481_09097 [Tolypothrix sp. PCC 7601]|nr:hypothetical protein FDUTEX481_09097 [Tolypothrix sp. PCC 7601]